jgi:class 3 adenylate cyclase
MPAPRPGSESSGAERRQLTVMFCDLVGSTALSSRLDPEDLRDVIRAYHLCVADTVGRFDGFVAKYMGDGVLVYFGYPRAQENDAKRAEDGLAQMHNGFAEFRPTRSGYHLSYLLGRLAEAQARLDKIEEGRQTIERALAIADRSGDQSWESDLYRLNGDLLLSLSRREEAETSLASAISIAKK